MQKYINDIIGTSGSTLSPITGATCSVYLTGTSTLATLYSDNGVTPKANPISSSATGRIEFYAADGRYDISVAKTGYTTVTLADILLEDPANAQPGVFTTLSATGNVSGVNTTGTISSAASGLYATSISNCAIFANSSGAASTIGHIVIARAGVTKGYLGTDSSDNLALIDGVGSIALSVSSSAVTTPKNFVCSAATGVLNFTGASYGQIAATGDLYLDAGASKYVYIRPNGSVTAGLFSAAGLAVTGTLTTSGGSSGGFPLKLKAATDDALRVQTNPAGSGVYLQATNNAEIAYAPLATYAATHTWSDGTTRMFLDSSGNLLVGVTSANANGGVLQLKSGITFPATQVTSSDANTLDDYEEGTWTPSVGGTATYSSQAGQYVKVGKQVTVNCFFQISTIGTGSTTTISGLPFTPLSYSGGSVTYFANLATNVINLVARSEYNTTTVDFISSAAASGTCTLPAAILGSSARVDFTITYFV
jgi:hypothetical protein